MHFPTREEAQEFAEGKTPLFPYVWFSERLEYKTEKSRWKSADWIRTWCSEATGLVNMQDGWGYRMKDDKAVEYRRF